MFPHWKIANKEQIYHLSSQQVRSLSPDDLLLIRQRLAAARKDHSGERRRKGFPKRQSKHARDHVHAKREAEESAAIDGLPRIPVRATAESLFVGCFQAEPRFLSTVPRLCAVVRDHLCLQPVCVLGGGLKEGGDA